MVALARAQSQGSNRPQNIRVCGDITKTGFKVKKLLKDGHASKLLEDRPKVEEKDCLCHQIRSKESMEVNLKAGPLKKYLMAVNSKELQ